MAVSKYEIRAKKELEANGWIVDDKRGMTKWAKNKDFFNLFDLVALKKGEPLRWISIKGKKGIPIAHRTAIEEFPLPENNTKEIWKRSLSKKNYWHKIILQ